jgi:anti-sigma factor RsiW
MSDRQQHQLEWNDRLQEWLDGQAGPAAASEVEQHLARCQICQDQIAALTQLDEALQSALPRTGLDAAFDQRLLAQIDSIDEAARRAARERIEQELQENLRALSRSWRRTLAFVVPGVLGGLALAFAIVGWFDDAGVTRTLAAESAAGLGSTNTQMFQTLLTALFGASIGLVLARWLATVAE